MHGGGPPQRPALAAAGEAGRQGGSAPAWISKGPGTARGSVNPFAAKGMALPHRKPEAAEGGVAGQRLGGGSTLPAATQPVMPNQAARLMKRRLDDEGDQDSGGALGPMCDDDDDGDVCVLLSKPAGPNAKRLRASHEPPPRLPAGRDAANGRDEEPSCGTDLASELDRRFPVSQPDCGGGASSGRGSGSMDGGGRPMSAMAALSGGGGRSQTVRTGACVTCWHRPLEVDSLTA